MEPGQDWLCKAHSRDMLRNTGRTQAARDTDLADRAWQPLLQIGNAAENQLVFLEDGLGWAWSN